MAKEIIAEVDSGLTVYALLRDPDNPAQAYDAATNDGSYKAYDPEDADQQIAMGSAITISATQERHFADLPSGIDTSRVHYYDVYDSDGNWLGEGSVLGLDAAGTRAALGLASANLDTQLGALNASAAPILQHDIAPHFIFKFSGRNDGVTSAVNSIRLATTTERPRIGFEVDTLTEPKPGIVTNVEVLDSAGSASAGITVADEEDTTNCGVRDWLIMSKVTNVTASGTYTVRVTFTAADNAVYVVSGEVVVP